MKTKNAAVAWSLSLALVAAHPSSAQEPAQKPSLDQALELARVWLEGQRAFQQIPGVSAAIVQDQQVLWAGGFGLADRDAGRPADPDTIYSVCSISKLFTAVALMQQSDAGRLRLDDPVARHLPWFRIQPADAESGPVTIEGVLTHASGLPRESDYPYWTGPAFAFPTREQVIERVSAQRMLQPAETYFQYSNLGLTLAGEVAAAAAGVPYAQLVRRDILDPLGLTSTTPEMPEDQRGRRLAQGYGGLGREGRRQAVPFFTAKGVAPAAGYASTVRDLARFASWQFRLLATAERRPDEGPRQAPQGRRAHVPPRAQGRDAGRAGRLRAGRGRQGGALPPPQQPVRPSRQPPAVTLVR